MIGKAPLSKRALAISLALGTSVCLGTVVVPMGLIHPFRTQYPRSLALALWILQVRPWLSIVAATMSLVCVAVLWSRSSGRRLILKRIGLATVAVLTLAFAVLAHINLFEYMFHPNPGARFAPAEESPWGANDMVIAVRVAGQARAYPIREMAYHHVINDVVAGVPLVATY